MSEKDIAAGAHWSQEIAGTLEKAAFGIICVTPENRDRPWLLFEAGALAKAFETARVVPYLFGFRDKSLPGSPLSQLQAKLTEKDDTFDLVKSLNDALGDRKLDIKRLEKAFAKWWSDLDTALKEIPPDDDGAVSPKPSIDDRLAELLDLARAQKAQLDALNEVVVRRPMEFLLGRRTGGLAEALAMNRKGKPGSLADLEHVMVRADYPAVEKYVPHNADTDDDRGANG